MVPPTDVSEEVAPTPAPAAAESAAPAAVRESYRALLADRIERHKRYPSLARRRRLEGTVVAELTIGSGGDLESVRFPERAHRLLARSTEDAISRAAPFPPPPGGALRIRVPLDYRIDDR